MGENIYFSVGPTQLYPTVPGHIRAALNENIPSISHRGAQFMAMYEKTIADLRTLMSIPASYEVFFTSSGTEGMERGIQNCVTEKSAHVIYGAFSKRWSWISKNLRKQTEESSVPFGAVPNLAEVSFSEKAEMICLTQNETSTGGMIQPSAITEFGKRYPDALIGVDVVSSVPAVSLDWGAVDYAFFGGQKAFGLPAGLGMIAVSPRAFQKADEVAKKTSIGSYHSFHEFKKYGDRKQTPETPNVLAIYLLHKVLEDMLSVGISELQKGVEKRTRKFYEFLGSQNMFTPFVKTPHGQSLTTIAVEVRRGSKPVIEALKAQGMIVGSGYGDRKEKDIRVANFPAHTDEHFDRLISALKELSARA